MKFVISLLMVFSAGVLAEQHEKPSRERYQIDPQLLTGLFAPPEEKVTALLKLLDADLMQTREKARVDLLSLGDGLFVSKAFQTALQRNDEVGRSAKLVFNRLLVPYTPLSPREFVDCLQAHLRESAQLSANLAHDLSVRTPIDNRIYERLLKDAKKPGVEQREKIDRINQELGTLMESLVHSAVNAGYQVIKGELKTKIETLYREDAKEIALADGVVLNLKAPTGRTFRASVEIFDGGGSRFSVEEFPVSSVMDLELSCVTEKRIPRHSAFPKDILPGRGKTQLSASAIKYLPNDDMMSVRLNTGSSNGVSIGGVPSDHLSAILFGLDHNLTVQLTEEAKSKPQNSTGNRISPVLIQKVRKP